MSIEYLVVDFEASGKLLDHLHKFRILNLDLVHIQSFDVLVELKRSMYLYLFVRANHSRRHF